MPLSLPDDVGISRFGRAAFKYIDDAERPKALLCKAIEYIERHSSKQVTRGLWFDPEEALGRLEKLLHHLEKGVRTPPKSTLPTKPIVEHAVYSGVPEKLIEDAVARNLSVIEEGLELVGRQ